MVWSHVAINSHLGLIQMHPNKIDMPTDMWNVKGMSNSWRLKDVWERNCSHMKRNYIYNKKSMLSLKKRRSGSWKFLSKKEEKRNNRASYSLRLFLTDLYPTRLWLNMCFLLFKKKSRIARWIYFLHNKKEWEKRYKSETLVFKWAEAENRNLHFNKFNWLKDQLSIEF